MRSFNPADTVITELPFSVDPVQPPRPFSSLVSIDFGASSHTGYARPNNQDAYIIYRSGRYWEKVMTSLEAGDLPDRSDEIGYGMAVADGMGGAASGEVASTMAIRVLMSLILNAAKWALKLDNPETRETELKDVIERAEEYFQRVDQTLMEYAEAYPRLKGMGTTMTGAYSFGDDLFILHIGDTRAYLFRQNKLKRLTHDQTVAQALADAGAISPEEVSTHRMRHTLTSVLGGESRTIQMEIRHVRLLDGDRLLLCSDGLTDMVNEQEIAEVIAASEGSSDVCDRLMNLALEKGGKDNVTVLLARYSIPNPLS
ncbi:protein phosphatase 2C domain-containing protein [bacterium]|nr:protein phosphatase 2C domain-containing protein [bacterium]